MLSKKDKETHSSKKGKETLSSKKDKETLSSKKDKGNMWSKKDKVKVNGKFTVAVDPHASVLLRFLKVK